MVTDTVTEYGVALFIVAASKPATMHYIVLDIVEVMSHEVPSLNVIDVLSAIVSKPEPESVNISPPS